MDCVSGTRKGWVWVVDCVSVRYVSRKEKKESGGFTHTHSGVYPLHKTTHCALLFSSCCSCCRHRRSSAIVCRTQSHSHSLLSWTDRNRIECEETAEHTETHVHCLSVYSLNSICDCYAGTAIWQWDSTGGGEENYRQQIPSSLFQWPYIVHSVHVSSNTCVYDAS